jgi:hypothetical protein
LYSCIDSQAQQQLFNKLSTCFAEGRMVTLHSKVIKSAGMALATAALLLSTAPAMAWSYGNYGGHRYGILWLLQTLPQPSLW